MFFYGEINLPTYLQVFTIHLLFTYFSLKNYNGNRNMREGKNSSFLSPKRKLFPAFELNTESSSNLAKWSNTFEQCSVICVFLKHLQNFTGKHLCQTLYLSKTADLSKIETLTQVLSCGFCEIFKNTFFAEHLMILLMQF